MRSFLNLAVSLTWILALGLPLASAAEPAVVEADAAKAPDESVASHEQLTTVEVKGKEAGTLQTLTVTKDGTVVGLVGASRYAPIGVAGKAANSELHLFDRDGKPIKHWVLPFKAQAVGAGPDGAIYVAGDGRVAKYAVDGKLLTESEVPHLAAVLKDQESLRKAAEAQREAQQASYKNMIKVYEDNIKRLEEKGDALTDLEKRQLTAYKSNLKAYAGVIESQAKQTIEDIIAQLTLRMRSINSIAATDKDVYIACGELKGYGYAIWRMDTDFNSAERVLGPVSGCCGQMDVQAHGDSFYIAENTKKRVAQYDRTGKLVNAFGKSGRESVGLEFAGCCNPMNCRVCDNGDIYTSESEGIVKRFSASGDFLGLVGYAKLTGGCKNVAVAASPKGDRVYFCDLPGSRIIILAAKKDQAATAGGGN